MKKYKKERIQEMIEDYVSLTNSLSEEAYNLERGGQNLYKKDSNGHYKALILPKKMYDEIKAKVEFIDNCIPLIKNEVDICILEARLKGLENKHIRKHYKMKSRTISKLFDNIINTFYESKFNDKEKLSKVV